MENQKEVQVFQSNKGLLQAKKCNHSFSHAPGVYEEEICIYCGETRAVNKNMEFTLGRWIE